MRKSGYREARYGFILPPSIASNISPTIALGNLASLQELYFPELGSNRPLWSLAYEVWYYILFPFLAYGILGKGSLLSRAICLIVSAGLLVFVKFEAASFFIVWLIGVGLAFVPARPVARWQTGSAALLLIAWLAVQSLKIVQSPHVTGTLDRATGLLLFGGGGWFAI